MADGVRFNVTGMGEIKAKMAQLNHQVNYKGGRSALRKAMVVLRDQAQENARRLDDSSTPEAIWKNIDLRWNNRAFKRNGTLAFRLGVLGGARQYATTKANTRAGKSGKTYATGGSSSNPGGNTWYWRFLEFGTSKIEAKPFLRPIIRQAGQKAIDTFASEFGRVLDRALAKQNKQ